MADIKRYITQVQENGNVMISEDVVTTIVANAALEVDGVEGLHMRKSWGGKNMKILIVNDDSIHAPGIAVLAKEAMKLGEVTVVAPAHQCSAMSQKISIRGKLAVEKVDFPVPVKAAYQVDGTPADCVKAALHYVLKEKVQSTMLFKSSVDMKIFRQNYKVSELTSA